MQVTRRDFIRASAAAAATSLAGLEGAAAVPDAAVTYGRAQCRFCGTGCTVLAGIKGGRIVAVRGDPDSPVNFGRLCVKGYCLDRIMYASDRLTEPMVRQPDGSWRGATWDAALDLVADTFTTLIRQEGPDSVAWYGSGQNTTQEAYAANKLFKGIIGTANVEGNPRLCMASAVGGYLNTFGADEPAGTYDDFEAVDCFFIIGSNMAENHPMLFRRVVDRKSAYPNKVRIIVADPRRAPSARHADLHLRFRPGYDMHLLNAMAHVIVEEGMVDEEHLRFCTVRAGLKTEGGFTDVGSYRTFLADYAPEAVADVTGVPASELRRAARWFGQKGAASFSVWCMGINQRTKGVQLNCLIHNLHLLTGKIGRPGCDSFSLTGQPNACGGTREQGGLTHLLPGHRAVGNADHREFIAGVWGVPPEQLPRQPTGSAVDMFMRLADKKVKAIWINTTNPGQSLPNAAKYRDAMREAFTVVSDIYPTRTTELASVILPSAMWIEKEGVMGQTDRRSQFTAKLVDPPGDARSDFWQIQEVAKRVARKLDRPAQYRPVDPYTGKQQSGDQVFGLGFQTEEEAWDEYRLCTRGRDVDLWGATYAKLKAHAGGVQWPCPGTAADNRGSAKRYIDKGRAQKVFGQTKRDYATGYVTLYDQHLEEEGLAGPINYYGDHPFHTGAAGKAIIRMLPAGLSYEMPDKDYPFVLNTGRVLEHWHTATMTMRVRMLREMSPNAYVEIAAGDAERLEVETGDAVKLTSRRGEIVMRAWITERAQRGMVFVPWFDEKQLINLLTVDVPESWSAAGEPDYKICAVRIAKA